MPKKLPSSPVAKRVAPGRGRAVVVPSKRPVAPRSAAGSGPKRQASSAAGNAAPQSKATAQEQLIESIAGYTADPLGYMQFAWDWGQGELADSVGLRKWQGRVAAKIDEHLQNPATRFQPCLVAVSSGHGIGKSAFIGMLMNWAMSTCEDTKVVLTANTDTQMRTKTMPEVNKWFRLAVNTHWWEMNATSIRIREKRHSDSWRADAIPWNENNTEAFQGLHNIGKRILVIFDEGSGISDKIYEVTEGALTDANTEIIWVVFSNPTQNTGRFRECFGRFKHRWYTFQVDSREVEGTNKALFEEWARAYGDDSDFFRIRVKGEFPRAGFNQLIPNDCVATARCTVAQGYTTLAKVLSVDVARYGDDQTVIGSRQGRRFTILEKIRKMDTVFVAERTAYWIKQENPEATVVDGDGIGGAVVDHLKSRGFSEKVFEFHGGAAAHDDAKYFNRRAEVWGMTAEWLQAGAQIPDDPELEMDLTGPKYGYSNKSQIQLEKKEDMKKRGLASPDLGDCLAMTFSVKVAIPKPPAPPRMLVPGFQNQSWMS